MSEAEAYYDDEQIYMAEKGLFKTIDGWASSFLTGVESKDTEVIPHNTMRFDVHLPHVYAFFNDGVQTKENVADAIRGAILEAIEHTLGKGLDGISLPSPPFCRVFSRSVMLHREMISVDLS